MTDTLLIIIAVLLAVRIVMQLRLDKRAFEKTYCAPSEVENRLEVSIPEPKAIEDTIRALGQEGWELVSVAQIDWRGRFREVYLFFTRKKIKNFYEK